MRRTAFITGASSGIGLELSRLFAKDGYNLVLVARNEEKLNRIAEEIHNKYNVTVKYFAKDLTLKNSPDEIFNELQKQDISVEALVNCAGFNVYGKFWETDEHKEMDMIQTNLVSLTRLTKLFLPEMIKRGHGRILNIGSIGSFQPVPLNAVYCATKAYVLSFSEGIADDLKGTGITVTAACPGPTKTDFAKRAGIEHIKLFRYMVMDAEKVAQISYKAMIKGKSLVIPGLMNKMLIFSSRFMPRKIVLKIGKFFMIK